MTFVVTIEVRCAGPRHPAVPRTAGSAMTEGVSRVNRITRSARWALHTSASLVVFVPLVILGRRGVTHGSGIMACGEFVAVDHSDFWPHEEIGDVHPRSAVIRHANSFLGDDMAADVRGLAVAIQSANGQSYWDFLTNTGETAEWSNVPMWTERLWGMIRLRGHVYFRHHPEAIPNAVNGLRRAPTSYADLIYYGQIALRLNHPAQAPRIFRMRAQREHLDTESGLISEEATTFAQRGWVGLRFPDLLYGQAFHTKRAHGESRPKDALRQEFASRLKQAPVVYLIQVQLRADEADARHVAYDPMVAWDRTLYPWETIGRLEVRAALADGERKHRGFSLAVHPSFIEVPAASSVDDYTSLANLRMTVYTVMQRLRSALRV